MNTPSPCIGVCQLAENAAVCIGCHRTLAEIAAWYRMTDAEKLDVLAAAKQRHQAQAAKTTTPQAT